MGALWLTYAWKDNEENDVDHVIAALGGMVEVRYDRNQLLAGQRLWDQIAAAIADPAVTAWAIYVTEHSLASEPCQEELAYALDRALRTRGSTFPLIGIFPRPLDRSLIPTAIATRLYVDLRDPAWSSRVAAATTGAPLAPSSAAPPPFGFTLHPQPPSEPPHALLEVWPRSGRWYPFVAYIAASLPDTQIAGIYVHPRGAPAIGGITVGYRAVTSNDGAWRGVAIQQAIDPASSAFIHLRGDPPPLLHFGELDAPLFTVEFNDRR